MRRSQQGQALVEGSAFLVFFVPIAVGLLIMILCAGSAEYYHLKMLNVAQAMAQQVVADTFWEGNQYNPKPQALSANEQSEAGQLLADLGLPSDPSQFSVAVSDDASGTNCVVNLTVNGLPLPGAGVLPSFISLSATAVEPWNINKPPFAVGVASSVGLVFVPAYRPNNATVYPASATLTSDGQTLSVYNALFNSPADAPGCGEFGLNYAGYGSSTQSTGAATHTGAVYCALAPWTGPVNPMPAQSSYPQN